MRSNEGIREDRPSTLAQTTNIGLVRALEGSSRMKGPALVVVF